MGPVEVTGGEQLGGSVAAGASARVGSILSEAERDAAALREEAERQAAQAERAGREEAERIVAEAREGALAAGRERAEKLLALRDAIAARGPKLVEGLDGAGLTRKRLEALMAALEAAAERVVAEADAPAPDSDVAETAAGEEAEEAEPPVSAAEEPDPTPATETPGVDGDGDPDAPVPYDGPLPKGAPMARKPRARSSDVRFAAVLLAVQGREREEVERHLRSDYGAADDCDPILDEVFGPARA